MSNYNERYVAYHSPKWHELVTQGWVTASVDQGVARLIKERSDWDRDDDSWRAYRNAHYRH